MLASTHRFHGHASLGFVYKHGQTVRSAHAALKYVTNSRRDNYRVAVVVGRKADKSAVVRNRIRRRLYEVVRLLAADITQPYDLVFVVYDNYLADCQADEIQRMVFGLLRKAGVITGVKQPNHGIVGLKERDE